jgi:uncharacterized RDD family membrane protein YckC
MSAATPYLASMEKRMAAAAIDCLVVTFVVVMSLWAIERLSLDPRLPWGIGFLMYVGYQAYALHRLGGMGIGRSLMGICVVSTEAGVDLSFVQSISRPTIRVIWLVTPTAMALELKEDWLLAVVAVPVFLDLFFINILPQRQTIADLICRTVVVNTPPLQPHRAPAAPMYSATDREFGVRPRKLRYVGARWGLTVSCSGPIPAGFARLHGPLN